MLKFQVKSSSGGAYKVRAKIVDGVVVMTCSCPAGTNGYYCKHRVGLLDGNADILFSKNINDLETLREWVRGTRLETAYKEQIAAEEALIEASERVKRANVDLARALHGG